MAAAESALTLQSLLSLDREVGTHLSKSLRKLRTFLALLGFSQYTFLRLTLSWLFFLFLGIAVPVLLIHFFKCVNCSEYQISEFEYQILVFQSLVAATSLVCMSHNLNRYGLRKFLFVDRYRGHLRQFAEDYAQRIDRFFKLLAMWLLPCLVLKTAREVVRVVYVPNESWWQSILIAIAFIVSWTYANLIFLTGCALFNLICNFQVIHLENYGKLLETNVDVSEYVEEHIRLLHYQSKISHRFRMFFILELLLVTASQLMSLLQTLSNKDILNVINGGDIAVASIVELAGVVVCLHAAAKITHRALGVASVASRWHALVTCRSSSTEDPPLENANTDNRGDAENPSASALIDDSDTDLEAVDYVPLPRAISTYHKRQAFLQYLQLSAGGFSVYGWRIDRTLINTIFFIELSLVFFVLGKTLT